MTAVLDDHHFLVMAPSAVHAAVVIAVANAVRLDDYNRWLGAGAGSAKRHCNADGRERGKCDSKFTHEEIPPNIQQKC
jgi:hypothetical protein